MVWKFAVLKKTAKGNLLLSLKEKSAQQAAVGIEKKVLFDGKQKAALVFDTIASVREPFFLAKPLSENAEALVGRVLSSEKRR